MFLFPFDTLQVTFSQTPPQTTTDRPTDRKTDRQTTTLLELLREAKNWRKLQNYKYGIEIAGMNLREGTCGREIEGVKLWE